MIRRVLPGAALIATMAASQSALAGDVAMAEALFRQGRELMDKGDFASACPKLAESFAQDPATGTLLALGMCQEQAGQTASAWATYSDVVTRAKQDGRADREQAARDRMQALDPKLSRLTIEVDPSAAGIPGLAVKRDGVAVGKGAWGTPTPVDPGEHVVEATAPGKRSWKTTVTVGAVADGKAARIPELENEASEPTAAAASASIDGAEPAKSSTLRTVGLVVGGAGILGLGISGYFGLRAVGLNSDSKKDGHCDANDKCDPTGLSARNDAVSASNVATVMLVAGGVLTAAGVTLFVVGAPKGGDSGVARFEAAPVVGWGTAGVLARGRF